MSVKFKHVDYLWDDKKASALGNDHVALFLYRSNILGADLRITNYAGGNTSCKTMEKDSLTNEEVQIMWVKESGGDIGTLDRSGIAVVYTSRLRDLKNVYGGLDDEGRMVELFNHCIYDLDSKTPSIDTPLNSLLPFAHIDHLHSDALIAVTAVSDSEKMTKEIWGETMGWIPWQSPGFDLELQLEKCLKDHPSIRGIVLGSHGLFTWGDTSHDCYINSLEVIEMASQYIEDKIKENGSVFGGQKIESFSEGERKEKAAQIMPILRGLCSSKNRMIGHFSDTEVVLEFINSNDLVQLAPMGNSCPDHFFAIRCGSDKIKVNTINPDGVIMGSKIWEGKWAEGRAKAYGITVDEMPAHYAKRNLLNEIIYPSDIADGVFSLVGILHKTTRNIINVDGEMVNAFVR
ncbi:class II aldolase/adducin family protein [Flagellimonas sp. CMM7]|uniref:class II aldolase/adducin family protein n=1 Tax=Flagellimonas sp. CMM7 TaxID=2654676 RepID=UPI0013D67C31|nr:class II aldolase/adducin family protein [Flagellimonas sp. CMM7]UII78753.1 class II aldolase/adducin family protein [Flagellimonas sp. CMM7]